MIDTLATVGQLAGAVELLQRSHAVAVKNLKQQKLEAPVDDADDGMEVQAQAAPKLPRPSTSKKRSAETTTSSSTGSSTGSAGNAGISSRASKKVKTAQKKRTKVDRWAQASRDVVKDFPKRYKEKEHLDRLEVVWRTVDSKPVRRYFCCTCIQVHTGWRSANALVDDAML